MIVTVMTTAKWLPLTRPINRQQVKDALSSNKAIYTISPSLFPRPDYWPETVKVLGYQTRTPVTNWQPAEDLNRFLESHDRVLFVTFGSMTNPDPGEKTNTILETLERNKIPAIINTASGGLVKPPGFDSQLVRFVSQISYDWILPRVYGVIHHGGSGTTHLGLKSGCATMIIPHIIDQFLWDTIVGSMGLGPKGVAIDRMTTKNLEPRILELVGNSAFRERARQVAGKMEREQFEEKLYETIVAD
jgi:UDP:flavonoid glycosyltransferase YjiC (YdhE family)